MERRGLLLFPRISPPGIGAQGRGGNDLSRNKKAKGRPIVPTQELHSVAAEGTPLATETAFAFDVRSLADPVSRFLIPRLSSAPCRFLSSYGPWIRQSHVGKNGLVISRTSLRFGLLWTWANDYEMLPALVADPWRFSRSVLLRSWKFSLPPLSTLLSPPPPTTPDRRADAISEYCAPRHDRCAGGVRGGLVIVVVIGGER